jgi:hypothetical protein
MKCLCTNGPMNYRYDMIYSAVTVADWSLVDCIVDLEMSVTKVVVALEVAGPGQLREDQVGALWKLESQALIARELAPSLRQKHLEGQLQPTATSTPISQPETSGKGRTSKLRLDVALAAEKDPGGPKLRK